MLQFCVSQSLCILNSFFAHDISHQATWRHKRWHTWGLLGMAVSRLSNRRFVMDVHAVPEAEVQSDHSLVIMKLRACPDTQPAVATQQPDRSFLGLSRPRRLYVQRLREPSLLMIFFIERPQPALLFCLYHNTFEMLVNNIWARCQVVVQIGDRVMNGPWPLFVKRLLRLGATLLPMIPSRHCGLLVTTAELK